MTPQGDQRAAQRPPGPSGPLQQRAVYGVTKPLPEEVGMTLCAARHHRSRPPPPQGFGAVAAFERGDRTATVGTFRAAVPRAEAAETGHAAQAERPAYTHGASAASHGGRRYRSAAVASHMFRKPGGPRPHVPAAQGRAVSSGGRTVPGPAAAQCRRAATHRTAAGRFTRSANAVGTVDMLPRGQHRTGHRMSCGRRVGTSARSGPHRGGQSCAKHRRRR